VEFNRDVEFILTKIPGKGNVSLFAASSEHVKELEYLLKRPITLSVEERTRQLPSLHVYRGREIRPSTMLQLIYAHNSYSVLVLVRSREESEELRSFLQTHGISCRQIDRHTAAPLQSHEKEEAESYRCTVTTFKDARSLGLHYRSIVFFGIPEVESLFIDVAQTISDYAIRPTLSVVVPPGEEDSFSTIQEKFQMNSKDEQFPEKEEVLKGQLKSIVRQIKEEENPEVLNSYRKLIRKSVPFFMRGYLAAYLFKNMVQGETPEAVQSEASEMQTIFVSIGKNRKVFPRDLARLFRSKVDLGPNDIGNIKVLDNYSFIDIPKDRAKQAIDKMDNMDYRGRSITVNFARKKNEKRRPPQRGKKEAGEKRDSGDRKNSGDQS
jgi:ATP-dependent RNA helicase DeaD